MNFDALSETILICDRMRKKNISVSKSCIQKKLRERGFDSQYVTIMKYVEYLQYKNIVTEDKEGRECIIKITDKGDKILKCLKILKQEDFFSKIKIIK